MRCILCRYNVPHDVQLITDFVGDGLVDVALARSLGSQYMNACCIPVFSITKSNSDLRFLHAFSMEYSVKYSAKNQGMIDDEKALKIRKMRSRDLFEAVDAPRLTIQTWTQSKSARLVFEVYYFTALTLRNSIVPWFFFAF